MTCLAVNTYPGKKWWTQQKGGEEKKGGFFHFHSGIGSFSSFPKMEKTKMRKKGGGRRCGASRSV